jgi:two-component system, chemotaxis family, chemotaxis protein CheY
MAESKYDKIERHSKPILIVEDIQTNRELVIRYLQRAGYSNFLEASNGRQALDRYSDQIVSGEIELHIVDSQMDVMDGQEYLENVFKLNPSSKAIVTTGHPGRWASLKVEKGIKAILVKPHHLNGLAKVVSDVLAGIPVTVEETRPLVHHQY